MFVNKEIKKQNIKKFIDRHGTIKKIKDINNNVIGFLIRQELENNQDESKIFVSISWIKDYCFNKTISVKNCEYFAIEHLKKINIEKLKKIVEIDENFNENDLKNKIINYINIIKIVKDLKLDEEKTVEFLLFSILNVKNYYKNKKVKIYF